MKSLQGHLLVASPHLPDPNFYRTVVLMIQHSDQGALGVVLNRPSQTTVREVISKVSNLSCAADDSVGVGGPIEGPLMAVHRLRSCSESEVMSGVYFAQRRDHILKIVERPNSPYRLFSGYAGWGMGQLELELRIGGWLTVPGSVDYIFGTPTDQLWKKVTGDIGSRILNAAVKVKQTPQDPSMN